MLLKQLSSKDNIESAFCKAINERVKNEHAMFISEITYAVNNKEEYLNNIQFELSSISHYSQEAGFYYTIPKSDMVDRFIVYLPLKELIIRYAFIQIIAESIDDQLIQNCFANRLSESDKFFTQNFAKQSWPNYCSWQLKQSKNNEQMIVTDLSGYYDSISHQKLISIIARRMGIYETDPFLIYFARILQQKVMLNDGNNNFIEINRGIITGPCCDAVLGNIYLSDIDQLLNQNKKIQYGRYVDDIRIFSNSEECLKSAFSTLQLEIKKLDSNCRPLPCQYAIHSVIQKA